MILSGCTKADSVTTADTAFFGSCFGLIYFLAAIAMLLLGLMQGSGQSEAAEHVMIFRSPRMLSIGMGMFGMLFLAVAVWFSAIASDAGGWTTLLFVLPSLLLGVPCLLLTGSHDVSIDLEGKVCQVTRRWAFRTRKRSYLLSAASSVCVCTGGESYYVFLVVGGGTYKRFLLERFSLKIDATMFAQEVADKLRLAVRELPLQRLRILN